jgi:RNA polymerase sigma-70 factor (ECF subfamily)
MRLAAEGNSHEVSGVSRMGRSEELMVLITSSQKPLFVYIRSLVGRTSDADDILQEVNLVLWRRGHEYDGRVPFLSWACRIAYMQVLAHYQKRRRARQMYFDEDVLADLAEFVGGEVERVDARIDALRGCLARLSPSQRRMILLRYEDGGSTQKVAGEIGQPLGSVRVALHRIRQVLAECIGRTLARGEGL